MYQGRAVACCQGGEGSAATNGSLPGPENAIARPHRDPRRGCKGTHPAPTHPYKGNIVRGGHGRGCHSPAGSRGRASGLGALPAQPPLMGKRSKMAFNRLVGALAGQTSRSPSIHALIFIIEWLWDGWWWVVRTLGTSKPTHVHPPVFCRHLFRQSLAQNAAGFRSRLRLLSQHRGT